MDIVYFIVGLGFALYGLSVFLRQYVRLNIGGGRRGRSPLFVVEVSGGIARLFGAFVILGGLLFASRILRRVVDDYDSSSFLGWLPAIGIVIMVIGILLCIALQASTSGREK